MQFRFFCFVCCSVGFILFEMFVVIVLIGIIGVVVVIQVGKNVDKGKYGVGKVQFIMFGQKVENYVLDNGMLLCQFEDLVIKLFNVVNWQGFYVKVFDLKDLWGYVFGYKYFGEYGSFDLIFYGQDGQVGGDGFSKDIGNWE